MKIMKNTLESWYEVWVQRNEQWVICNLTFDITNQTSEVLRISWRDMDALRDQNCDYSPIFERISN
jgi:hypothetical protein